MISPRRRRILPALLLVLSLTATGTAAAADGQAPAPGDVGKTSAAQASPRKAGGVDPNGPAGTAAPGKTRPATLSSEESCEPTHADSRERKAGAVRACVTTIATPVTTALRKSLAAAPPAAAPAAAADSGSCAITTPGTWWHSRFGYCVYSLTVLYTLKDGNDKEIGTGTLNVSSSAVLPAKGTKWNEMVVVTMTGATGAVTSLNVKFRAACSAGCKVTTASPWQGKTMVKDQVLKGNVSYASTPAAGTTVDFTTSYQMYVTAPGAQITDPNASWSNPAKIRCDDAVRDTTTGASDPGCVVPSIMPVVKMSDQQSPSGAGAAAAGYLWAQNTLPDGWGRGKPLTRARGDIAGRAARTCGSFQARTDLVATDSCDDFPFAVTREGGTDGAQCAELLPRHSSGGWVVDVLDGGTGSPCTRAHVPLADKQAAEGQLAEGFANQRVVEGDQFNLEIAGSITEPQAVCRQNTPAGAVPSGNGWIKNTTDPVPHINIKTNPLGPAGVRAAMAQACLGTVKGNGSDAKGDITGWLDADLFRTANSSTAGLARCHLIANILGGKGMVEDGGQINLVPCWQSGMNTGTPSMRTYEAVAQLAVKPVKEGGILGPNDAIFYEVTPDYRNSDSTIPVGVKMTARVERSDGTSQPLFPDVYITNTQKNTGLLNLGN